MQSIEFEAKPHNGIIRIPESYQDWYAKKVKVILLSETEPETTGKDSEKDKLRSFFNEFNADLTAYCFDREEANAR
ncbi:hypothetical protein QUF80_08030 [Desulfococcaceae bacterium HSG8]|nr:hypothetical protein [Desulfococcaceae bacterium HSG8]